MRYLLLIIFVSFISCKKKDSDPIGGGTTSPVVPPPSTGGSLFSSAAKIPVSPNTISECFTGMKMKDIHPRLLFSSSEIEQIKILIQSDAFAKATYDNIIARANSLLTHQSSRPNTYFFQPIADQPWHRLTRIGTTNKTLG